MVAGLDRDKDRDAEADLFCRRFQQGVDDRPTRWPISATESEASSCTTARIFRSTASILY